MKKFNKNKYLRKLKIKRFFRNNSRYFYIVLSCLLCGFLGIYFTYSKFFISDEQEVIRTTVGDFTRGDIILNIYVDGKKVSEAPKKNTGYSMKNISCNNGNVVWSDDNWKLTVTNISGTTKCDIYFIEAPVYKYYSTAKEETLTIQKAGYYKLETWGAQGGSADTTSLGGYGAYSTGLIKLNKNDILYINVGSSPTDGTGGYNGGGSITNNKYGGGGATHIATTSGILSALENNQNDILIVAGGGGGEGNGYAGGSGGGINGTKGKGDDPGKGGTQSAGGAAAKSGSTKGTFGQGGSGDWYSESLGGGGGGYYGGSAGGGADNNGSGGGGSGYIGNTLLNDKSMYCYNCTESSATATKTLTTTCSEETPTENCSKKGNGYAKLTYIPLSIEYYADNIKQENIPSKNLYAFSEISCEKSSKITWDKDNWNYIINDYKENDTCKIVFKSSKVAKIINQLDTTDKCPSINEDSTITISNVESTAGYLCSAPDTYGTSYYYRGNVTNNYVYFAGFYWRIIRVNGDESVRIIYDGTSAHANGESSSDRQIGTSAFNSSGNDNAYVGYMYGTPSSATYAETHANINDSTIKTYLENWYKTNIADKNYATYVVDNIFCNDRSFSSENTGTGTGKTLSNYAAGYTSKTRAFTCPNKNDTFTQNDTTNGNGMLTYPVGLISVDEAVLAGGYSSANSNYYLYTGQLYWTMSPNYYDNINDNLACNRYINSNGTVLYAYVNDHVDTKNGVKPVINLKSDVLKNGDGTLKNPYHLSEEE